MYPERLHLSPPRPVQTPEAGTPEPETPEPEEERPSGGAQGTSAGRGTISAAQGESVLGRERPAQAQSGLERTFACFFPGCDCECRSSFSLKKHVRCHIARDCLRGATTRAASFARPERRRTETAARVPARSAENLEVLSSQQVARRLRMVNFEDTLELGIVLGLPADFVLSLLPNSRARMHRRQEPAMLLSVFMAGIVEYAARQEETAHPASRVVCHPAVAERNSREWLKAMAWAGSCIYTAQELASWWRIPLRTGDWKKYRCSGSERKIISQEVVRCWHTRRSDASFPLWKVWPLVSRYVHLPLFASALGYDDDTELPCHLVGPEKKGVVALLHEEQASGGAGLSWAVLMRLVRCRLIEPSFIKLVPAQAQSLETVSRAVQPADLLALVADSKDEARGVMEMAVALGIGLEYGELRKLNGFLHLFGPEYGELKKLSSFPGLCGSALALRLVEYIRSRVGTLETGHLAQVLRELGRRDLLKRLTGDADSHLLPVVPLAETFPRAEQFISLARGLCRDPVAVLKFTTRSNYRLECDWVLPTLAIRLLNNLALDAAVLEMYQDFVQAYRPASPTPPEALAISNSGLPCDYACPVTLGYMEAPVPTLGEGERVIYFEKAALLQALEESPYHPVTRAHMWVCDTRRLEVDMAHVRRIHQWRQAHPELEPDGVPFVPPAVVEQD